MVAESPGACKRRSSSGWLGAIVCSFHAELAERHTQTDAEMSLAILIYVADLTHIEIYATVPLALEQGNYGKKMG